MFKAKLFSYAQSGIYFKRYGISPDRHFDRLRERWGKDAALEIVDRNMQKALDWEQKSRQLSHDRYSFMPVAKNECPFDP